MGALMGGVRMPFGTAAALLGVLVAGSVTFCAFGLALAFFVGPNSAAPVVNLIYLPMGFLSGLWIPIQFLPKGVQETALWLPPYHFSQLALKIIGASRGESAAFHVGIMAVATVIFAAIAYIGYRRDEGKTYG
jgi:ABC-2 type transport system permease protein